MRLLFTIQYYDRPGGRDVGGMQISTRLLARHLARRGHEVSIFCGLLPGGLSWTGALALRRLRKRPLLFERDEDGIRVITSPVPDEAARDVLAAVAPDAVLAFGAGDLNQRVLSMTSAPQAVFYVHSVKAIATLAEPTARPHRVLAVSRFIVGEIGRLGIGAEFVAPLFECPEPRPRAVDAREVLFVNPVPEKGLDIALALAARRPDVMFRFARAWPLSRASVRALRSKTQELPNVRVTTAVATDDLFDGARLLLAPSLLLEAWGRVVTEAQLHGLPALASSAGGIPEAVGSGGIIVDPGAPIDEWERGFAAIWDDPSSYAHLAAEARRSAARPEISSDHVVSRVEEALAVAARRA